ncbi:MAG: HEAT repeat domain-containing protein [Acidobacteria bacterium]|nr:HEAT repeat domain-containing protein [Acidobacteriota bacterium]
MTARVWLRSSGVVALLALTASVALGQVLPFDSVVQNLKSPDPKVRLETLRLLRDAGYPEAAGPVAAVMTDPLPQLQQEAILTGLSFFLVEKVSTRRRVGGIVEVRSTTVVEDAFDAGPAATRARPVPREVIRGLLGAMSSPEPRARVQATYALGVLARTARSSADAALAAAVFDQLIARLKDPDPFARIAAARVSGRIASLCGSLCGEAGIDTLGDALVTALNDRSLGVKVAVMEGLGDLRYQRAVRALTDQFEFYQKGDGARAALFALGRIAHTASVPLFQAHLGDKDEVLRRASIEGAARAGDRGSLPGLQAALGSERNLSLILALAFAVQRLGGGAMLDRIVATLSQERLREQAQGYLIELGTPIAPALTGYLTSAAEDVRLYVAQTLGLTGTQAEIAALEAATRDGDARVSAAAAWAIEMIRIRQ